MSRREVGGGTATDHGARRGVGGLLLVLVVVCVLLALLAQSASAQTSELRGTFLVRFPKGHPASNAPCSPEVFCGVGTLTGYGQATISILEESFEEIAGSSCLGVTRLEEIELLSGDGTLLLEGSGTFCRPGGSGESHAAPASYGGPGRWRLTFSVVAGSGVFEAVSGTGSETMNTDGGAGVWHLAGTLAS